MTTQPPERSAQGSRILSPDIARGIALLGIALANVATAWIPADSSLEANRLGGMVTGSVWEQIAVVLSAMFIHVRGLPMFSTMLGYGVGMIVGSLWRRRYPQDQARRVLVRRYGFLALFGLVHMIFLFWGDIMFFYGVAGMLLAVMMSFRDKTLWWFAGAFFLLNLISTLGVSMLMSMATDAAPMADMGFLNGSQDSYGEYLLFALIMVVGQVAAIPMEILMLFPVMIVGYIAARHRVLSRVDEFRRHLWTAVWIAVAVVMLIGLPWGLSEIGVLPSSWAQPLYGFNQAFGVLTGPGIIAAIALLVQPLQRRLDAREIGGEAASLSLIPRMIAALGARSMSGYILQSLLLLLATQPFTLGLGIGGGILGASVVAFGVWVLTVLFAYALDLAGRKGPFEAVHRRLSYGKAGLYQAYSGQGHALPPGASPLSAMQTPPASLYDNEVDVDKR